VSVLSCVCSKYVIRSFTTAMCGILTAFRCHCIYISIVVVAFRVAALLVLKSLAVRCFALWLSPSEYAIKMRCPNLLCPSNVDNERVIVWERKSYSCVYVCSLCATLVLFSWSLHLLFLALFCAQWLRFSFLILKFGHTVNCFFYLYCLLPGGSIQKLFSAISFLYKVFF